MCFMDTKSPCGLAKAIACFLTLKAFSEALGVKYQVVQQWLLNGVPAEHCPTIERLTGVRCEELNERVDWAYVRSNKQPKRSTISRRP